MATDLVPGGSTISGLPLFLRDLVTGTTTAVSSGGDGRTTRHRFSPDGSKILFEITAADLGATDTNGRRDIYMRDRVAGTTTLVSVRQDGLDSGNGESTEASFSPDGTQVVFTSTASNLVGTDNNDETDVFVRDLATATTSLVSTNSAGTDSAIAGSRQGSFTDDGKILFESLAWNLGPTDTNNDWDLYLHNLTGDVTSLVSAKADGTDSGDEASTTGSFGGGKVAYQSRSTGLATTDTNDTWDIYLATPYTPPPPTTTTTRPPPTTSPLTTDPPTTLPPTTEPPTTEPPEA